MTFRDGYKEFQYIINEIVQLRTYNRLKHLKDVERFLVSESVIISTAIERFLRITPVIVKTLKAKIDNDPKLRISLGLMLEIALVDKSTKFIHIEDPISVINDILNIRNVFVHGDYEQRANNKYKVSKDDYFREGFFLQDIDRLYDFLNLLLNKVNVLTGEVVS